MRSKKLSKNRHVKLSLFLTLIMILTMAVPAWTAVTIIDYGYDTTAGEVYGTVNCATYADYQNMSGVYVSAYTSGAQSWSIPLTEWSVSGTTYTKDYTISWGRTSSAQTVCNIVYDNTQTATVSDAVYVTVPARSGGGSSSGGGGAPVDSSNTTSITAKTGGTVTAAGLSVTIPADALAADFKVTVAKLTSTTGLPMEATAKLISDVFEITKDKAGDFSKNITLTITYDKSKVDTDKYDISICWLDTGTNKWVKLDNVSVDLTAGTVRGDVNHFTKFAVIATEKAAATLTDIAGHWAQANINNLVALGAITGYPDGTFKPDNNITRAEFATVLVKAFKLAPQTGKVFTDTANHWAKDRIATAAANGIVNGYSATTFGPDDLITREQMAVMIVRAAKLATVTGETSFKDAASISSWAKSAIATATKNGIIKGYPDNTVQPLGNSTRAEAVTVIVNAL